MSDLSSQRRFAWCSKIVRELEALPWEKRRARLDEACGDDEALRAEVEQRLAATEGAGGRAGRWLGARGEGRDTEAAARTAVTSRRREVGDTLRAPPRIGPYRLLRVLGEGGMGSVYEAEQAKPRRRVALKLLRTGLGTAAACQRFEREAEFLGQLNHPGIAKVLESGIEHDARDGVIPWIAMELIDGQPIARHAHERALDRRGRVELLIQACDALAHAHAKGIVHRDLKPDNILVDDRGRVRVLDFGVARAMGDATAGFAQLTLTGDIVGTITYMSPEQACGHPQDVDERSDLYSLGVVAFELLSGRLPQNLRGVPVAQAIELIRDVEAASLGSSGSGSSGDLEVIVAKALEKDPARRYQSVAELGADLRRYLDHEPIAARPPSTGYRIARFVRRHRTLVAAVSGIMLTLAAALAVSTHLAVRALDREEMALASQYRATLAAAEASSARGDVFAAGRLLDDAPEQHRGWEWRRLRASLDESLAHWSVPGGVPLAPAFSAATGDLVVATHGAIQVAEPVAGAVRWSWSAPPGGHVAALSRDGAHAIVIEHGEARLLTVGTGATTRLATGAPGQAGFSTDGATAWVRSREESGEYRLVVADGRTGVVKGRLPIPASNRDFRVTRRGIVDGNLAGSGLLLWNGEGEESWEHLDGPDVVGLEALPSGRRVVALRTSSGRTVAWDLETRATIPWKDVGPTLPVVQQLVLDTAGRRAVTVHADGVARLLDADDGRFIARPAQSDVAGFFCKPAFDEARGRLALAGGHHAVVLAGADDGTRLHQFHGHGRRVRGLAFRADGALLASVDEGGSVRVWDVANVSDPATLRGHESYVYDVAISPDGTRVASGAWDGTVRLWDLASGSPLVTLDSPAEHPVFGKLAWSPDGTRLAAVHGVEVALWNARTGELVGSRVFVEDWGAPTQSNESMGVAWHPSGEYFVVGSRLRHLHVYRVGARTTLPPAERWPIFAEAVAFSPDGRRLATTRENLTQVWDVETKSLHWEDASECGRSRTVAFSPDGTHLAAVSDDSHLRTWSVEDGTPGLRVAAHADQAHGVAWSPDGSRLATGGSDRVIRIWDADSGRELALLRGHDRYAYTLDWSDDGHVLVSGSGDGTVRLWDARPARERLTARRERALLVEELRPTVQSALASSPSPAAALDALDATPGWDETRRRVAADLVLAPGAAR